ncbi:MAG: hypothetical protein WC838_02775 [Candidatus Margulisiibacteriota bacterium]|jgi:hypothetical protein
MNGASELTGSPVQQERRTNMKNIEQVEVKNVIEPLVAAAAGALVGAGVVATGIVLKEKQDREELKQVLTEMKEITVEYLDEMKQEIDDKKADVKREIVKDTKIVKNVAASVKGSLHQAIEDAKKAVRAK